MYYELAFFRLKKEKAVINTSLELYYLEFYYSYIYIYSSMECIVA